MPADPAPSPQPLDELPPALPVTPWLGTEEHGDPPRLAVFLDYDGTLTPIVDDPDAALLSEATRRALSALAGRTPVAIVSGRDLDDVRAKVDVDGLAYAGSHGFDILHPDGTRHQLATELTPALDAAQAVLDERLADIPGARVERKRFAIAVHDRQVHDPDHRARIAGICAEVAGEHPQLRPTGGKRIHELRPDIDWDKGRAIDALLEELHLGDHRPVYVGDDLTDEDGFRAVLAAGGLAVVVRGEEQDRPTIAQAALDDPDQARELLEQLAAALTKATP